MTRRLRELGLWWVPILLLLLPLVGLAPAARDLADYFAPIRAATADQLRQGRMPWLNPANGCGEAWFANPQSGVLYPPHWLHLALPLDWALTAEVAVHLALLALGTGLLARRWGGGGVGRTVAEVAAWSAGPVVAAVGVLNNLEAMAWLPWLLLAAGRPDRWSLPMTAGVAALAWLAGEPQVWALCIALAVVVVPRARVLAGAAVGLSVVAVQAIPFLFWVVDGDRGPGMGDAALSGALSVSGWLALVAPGVATSGGDGMIYVESLFLGAPLLTCALLGAWQRRRVLVAVLALMALASLPATGAGSLYLVLTGGLVRYPVRFAMVAVVCLLPFIGPGLRTWREGGGRVVGGALAVVALATCAGMLSAESWLAGGVPAALTLAAVLLPRWPVLRSVAVGAGVVGVVVAAVPMLGVSDSQTLGRAAPAWPEARGEGRLYTSPLPPQLNQDLATSLEARRLWPVGYLNLVDGLSLARTYGPLADRRLTEHLAQADRGPSHHWWLDTLGARWVALPHGQTPEGMVRVRRQGGVWLYRNPRALPLVSVAAEPPASDRDWVGIGAATVVRSRPGRILADIAAPSDGWAWLSVAPVRSWSWTLDGEPVEPVPGPGITRSLRLAAGVHRLRGRYAPPGLAPALTLSLLACAVLCWLLVRARAAGRES